MNKCDILECMYKTIKDSLEWGFGEDNYTYFLDGIVTMTEATLEKLKESEDVQAERLKALDKEMLNAKAYISGCTESTGYVTTLSEDIEYLSH